MQLTTHTGLDAADIAILQEQPRIVQAAQMFIREDTGNPLDGIAQEFTLAATHGQEIYYLQEYAQATLSHCFGLVALHDVLCQQKLFLREDLPGIKVPPRVLQSLSREIARVFNGASQLGENIERMICHTGIYANSAPILAALEEQILRLEDDADFIGKDLPPIAPTRDACLGQMHELSRSVAAGYQGVVAAELREIKLDVGYHATLYGNAHIPRQKQDDIIRPLPRDQYAANLNRQLSMLGRHMGLLQLVQKKAPLPVYSI